MNKHLLHFVLLLINLSALFLDFLFALLPFLVHSFASLFGVFPGLTSIFLLCDPIRLKRMIFFELLILQCLLTKLLTLLGLMILVKPSESSIYLVTGGWGPTSARSYPLWVEGALPQFNMILEGLQTLQVFAFRLRMLI